MSQLYKQCACIFCHTRGIFADEWIIQQELQRFPRLHAQLIEVVSELLRERLGPTSEYTQSLIEIQAAYINTNHPAFVSPGMVMAAQQNVQPRPHVPPRPASAEPINGVAVRHGVEDEEDDDEDADSVDINGTVHTTNNNNNRSVSSTIHDRKSASAATLIPNSNKHKQQPARPHSSLGQANAGLTGSSPPSARETFLNYFFGQNGPGPLGSGADRDPSSPNARSSGGIVPVGRDISGGDNGMSSGLLAGKRSLDGGTNAALDMKSLGKHIEAVSSSDGASNDGSSTHHHHHHHLTVREEMETNLIRGLIASYFGIVRQSIQDLVPKAIMHFLVNHTSHQVQNRLVSALYKPELFASMLDEDEGIVAERTRVKALLDAYKEAFKTLSDIGMKPS